MTVDTRMQRLQQFAVGLFVLGLESPALAYLGEGILNWSRTYIIGPLGLIAVVVAIGSAIFRPDMVRQAIYTAIICAVLFLIIGQGAAIMSTLAQN